PSASSRHFRSRHAERWKRSWRLPSARFARSRTGAPDDMTEQLKAFLKFLALNRNASPHTVRAYESDLAQFIDHAAALAGVRRAGAETARSSNCSTRPGSVSAS